MWQKRKLGKKAFVDTSASEVTNVNEDAVRLALYFSVLSFYFALMF